MRLGRSFRPRIGAPFTRPVFGAAQVVGVEIYTDGDDLIRTDSDDVIVVG